MGVSRLPSVEKSGGIINDKTAIKKLRRSTIHAGGGIIPLTS
jgi:hypothetical protein